MLDNFVLAADEVWRLQGGTDYRKYREAGGRDPECLLFQDMAAEGHYGSGGGTKQGIYVCTPAGKHLASVNTLSARGVRQMLERGLDAWEKQPEEVRNAQPPGSNPDHRWEWNYPEDGLVLKQTARYLSRNPVDDHDRDRDTRFNFDYVWFSRAEAAQFLSGSPAVGDRYEVPAVLHQRFARYHLLNTAYGESGTYRAEEVAGRLLVEVLAVEKEHVRLRLSGNSVAAARLDNIGHSRAPRIAADLLGFASFNRVTRRFDRFEMVATGEVYSTVEPVAEDRPQRSIGWYFCLADPQQPFERLYPTQIYAYDVEWIRKPEIALHGLRPN
jgi:hypothetical protein